MITKKIFVNNELKNTFKGDYIILDLFEIIYAKYVLKVSKYKLYYKYNYSDKQTITITENYTNYDGSIIKYKYVYENIPTSLGWLDLSEFKNKLGGF